MRTLTDTWTTRGGPPSTTRSMRTIITVVLMPIALMLLFLYVFDAALEPRTSVDYVDFDPRWYVMTMISGIAAPPSVSAWICEGDHQPLHHAGETFVGVGRPGRCHRRVSNALSYVQQCS